MNEKHLYPKKIRKVFIYACIAIGILFSGNYLYKRIFKYNLVGKFDDGVAIVNKGALIGGKYGLINTNYKEIAPCIYDDIEPFTKEGLALYVIGSHPVLMNGETKYGFLDKTGREVIPPIYDFAESFSENLAVVSGKDFMYGYIDKDGVLQISMRYTYADSFSEGLAVVSTYESAKKTIRMIGDGTKYGYINKSGDIVIPCIYDNAEKFHNGKALVSINGNDFYINTLGHRLKN